VDRVVAAYWEHYRFSTSATRAERLASDERRWACDEVGHRVAEDADVLGLLVELADAAPDDSALAYLGAGPIEDFLVRHGASATDAVEAAAGRHPRFQTAVRCAWFYDKVPEEVVSRLRRFGPPL
jgi:hypothetical protein